MKKVVASLGVCLLLSLFSITSAFAAGPYTVVLDGLQSPRGLAFGPGGILYVAQAGSGFQQIVRRDLERELSAVDHAARDALAQRGGGGLLQQFDLRRQGLS